MGFSGKTEFCRSNKFNLVPRENCDNCKLLQACSSPGLFFAVQALKNSAQQTPGSPYFQKMEQRRPSQSTWGPTWPRSQLQKLGREWTGPWKSPVRLVLRFVVFFVPRKITVKTFQNTVLVKTIRKLPTWRLLYSPHSPTLQSSFGVTSH